MKKILFIMFCALFILTASALSAEQDQRDHASCSYCGMDRVKFAHSRMLVEYTKGDAVGTCSIHCMAVEFANSIDRTPKAIMVADMNTKQLIDAEKAIWVLGGSRPGVMTKRPKWAFSDKASADAFIASQSGEIINFDQAMTAAYEDMYKDTKMIREKRASKMKHMMHQ